MAFFRILISLRNPVPENTHPHKYKSWQAAVDAGGAALEKKDFVPGELEYFQAYNQKIRERREKIDECAEQSQQALFHDFMAIAGYFRWGQDHPAWDDCSLFTITDELEPDMHIYYALSIAWYGEKFFEYLFDTTKKDRIACLIHDLITIVLIFDATYFGYNIWGCLIIYVHEIADAFLTSAKVLRGLNVQPLDEIVFVGFVISWLYSRLYLYFNWFFYSMWYVFPKSFAREDYPHPDYVLYVGQYGMTGLGLLHLFWTWVIYKSIRKKLRTGVLKQDHMNK